MSDYGRRICTQPVCGRVQFAVDKLGVILGELTQASEWIEKTYALGVLLEPLLLDTTLPLEVFDPNSDYVRLGCTHSTPLGP